MAFSIAKRNIVQQIERDGFQLLPIVGPYIYIYTTLKFLALQGAPCIYAISRLRVKHVCTDYFDMFRSVVRVNLKLIKIGNYSQTQQFYCYKRRHVSALLLSHHQACVIS
jgi:hypothetical protein